jgi:hypothetical protein
MRYLIWITDPHLQRNRARLVHTRIIIGLVVMCVVLAGCAAIGGSRRTEFALSTTGHVEDWRRLQTALASAGIRCTEGPSDLGTLSLMVDSRDFDRAKQEATSLVAVSSLTLRMRASANSWAYEVWQRGKQVGEETYVIEKVR